MPITKGGCPSSRRPWRAARSSSGSRRKETAWRAGRSSPRSRPTRPTSSSKRSGPACSGRSSCRPAAPPPPPVSPAPPPRVVAPPPPPRPIAPAPAPVPVVVPGGRVKASPLAKKVAARSGVDLRLVQGSGPGGRIVRRDVEAALTAAPALAPVAIPAAPGVEYQDVPLSSIPAPIARRLPLAKAPVPHFYVTVE